MKLKMNRRNYLLPPKAFLFSQAEALTDLKVKTVKDAKQAAEALLQRGSSSVIITLGGEGAVYSTAEGHTHISAEKVTPVDTTVSTSWVLVNYGRPR